MGDRKQIITIGEGSLSGNQAVRNALILLAILVGTAVVTALWPLITAPGAGVSGASSPLLAEVEPIHLALPFLPEMELNPFVAIGLLAAIIIGPIVVIGGAIAFLLRLADKTTAEVVESESYKESVSTLEQREKERLQQMREGRVTTPMPDHQMPRWTVASNALIVVMFVVFFALMINQAFQPDSEVVLESETLLTRLFGHGPILNTRSLTLVTAVVVAGIISALTLRARRIYALNDTDNKSVPWDFIIVLMTGLLVVGLGLGIMVWLVAPA